MVGSVYGSECVWKRERGITISESESGKSLEHGCSRVHYLHPAMIFILIHCVVWSHLEENRLLCYLTILSDQVGVLCEAIVSS